MLVAAMLCYAGFSALCLAMERHHLDLLGARPGAARQRALRLSGWVLLAVAMAVLIASGGWAMGLIRFCGLAMASAGLLVGLLPYRPKLALTLAALALPIALLRALLQQG
ncbi:DUF3325 domain-containing protein [Pseudomonas sp. RIT-PI-S]|uniref:DUF3325 domain-containing protein n=1 Tax=Pseudomonas sp. RIT-PI-S TaxID=3035295 RepID=UPI0021D83CC9|nr:DUF3325 domain-containing protein [Pseudomonas sp. RIT-PI-S]